MLSNRLNLRIEWKISFSNRFYTLRSPSVMMPYAKFLAGGNELLGMIRWLFILKSEVQHTLSTLRFKTFAIGAYFQKKGNQTILKIALAKQRRKWLKDFGTLLIMSNFLLSFLMRNLAIWIYDRPPF